MEVRNDSITFKVSSAEKLKIELSAEISHTDKSEFCRQASLNEADKVEASTVLNPVWKVKWENYKKRVMEWQRERTS